MLEAQRWLYLVSAVDDEPDERDDANVGSSDCSCLPLKGESRVSAMAAVMWTQMANAGRAPEKLTFDKYGESPQTAECLARRLRLPAEVPLHHQNLTSSKDGRWKMPRMVNPLAAREIGQMVQERDSLVLLERLLPPQLATGVLVARSTMLELVVGRLMPQERHRRILPGQLLLYRLEEGKAPEQGTLEFLKEEVVDYQTPKDEEILVPQVWIYLMAHGQSIAASRRPHVLSQDSIYDIEDLACYDAQEQLAGAGRALHQVYARRGKIVKGRDVSPSAKTAEVVCRKMGLTAGLRDHGDPSRGVQKTPYTLLSLKPGLLRMRSREDFVRACAPTWAKQAATWVIGPPEEIATVSRLLTYGRRGRRPAEPGELYLYRCPIVDLYR